MAQRSSSGNRWRQTGGSESGGNLRTGDDNGMENPKRTNTAENCIIMPVTLDKGVEVFTCHKQLK